MRTWQSGQECVRSEKVTARLLLLYLIPPKARRRKRRNPGKMKSGRLELMKSLRRVMRRRRKRRVRPKVR
jgi:hypothetical protein